MHLFADNIAPFDGELYLIKQFYPPAQADGFMQQLLSDLAWQDEQLFLFGRWVTVPRLLCWYGDEQAYYQYSHVSHAPLPWTPLLSALRQHIQQASGFTFNSVLGNLYRNGRDSMGCHADNEPELGKNPRIASLSLGDNRRLRFTHPSSKTVLNLDLENGDLLIMAGELQHHWKHQLPKTQRLKSPRINLTFRKIYTHSLPQ